MIYDKLFQASIKELSKDMNLPPEVITVAYRSFWEHIKEKIEELKLKDDISEEEFSQLRTNFNIPSIGKLYITWDKLVRIKNRKNYIGKNNESN